MSDAWNEVERQYQTEAAETAAELRQLRAEIERLQAALALSQSQNYCTFCGAALDGTSGEQEGGKSK